MPPVILGADEEPPYRIPGMVRQIPKENRKQRNRIHSTARWQRLRNMSIKSEPICRLCQNAGEVVDHLDGNEKNNHASNLQTLCKECHDWKTNAFEKKIRLKEIESFDDYINFIMNLHNSHIATKDNGKTYITPPVYEVAPQNYVNDNQFLITFYASYIYHTGSGTYGWFAKHALPIYNQCKDVIAFNAASNIDELLEYEYNFTNHAMCLQLAIHHCKVLKIPYRVILQTACLLHYYEHNKQYRGVTCP